MDKASVRSTYRRLSLVYDQLMWLPLQPGRTAAIRAANGALPTNAEVLEVGIGTGLSLRSWRPDLGITGIDLSVQMLRQAEKRAAGLRNRIRLRGLHEMDAENMDFADGSFDCVVAMYVMSVTQNPAALVAEMQRVCVPGGRIIIANHFLDSRAGLRRTIEKGISPLARKLLGFHSDFRMIPRPGNRDLFLLRKQVCPPMGLFTVLEYRNDRKPVPDAQDVREPGTDRDPGALRLSG